MSEELGKLERPEAGQFREKRKLYLVPLLLSWEGAPDEYMQKFNIYWEQVRLHVRNLESRLGKVNLIYHESVVAGGEDGLNALEKFNPASYQLALEKYMSGARFEAVEERELAEESMDWERHMLIGFMSAKVARIVSDCFSEALKKRYEHIASRINETLRENETAVLFIREGHSVQFPRDIEVFTVFPPVLDEIHRWLRDRSRQPEGEPESSSESGQ